MSWGRKTALVTKVFQHYFYVIRSLIGLRLSQKSNAHGLKKYQCRHWHSCNVNTLLVEVLQ